MTWVEILIFLSVDALIVSLFIPRVRIRRAIQIIAALMLVGLLAIFGREFISDLF